MWAKPVEEHGFAIIPGVVPQEDVATLSDNLLREPLPRGRAGARHALKHHAVSALARDPRLLTIAREILGSEAFPFRATLFDKSQQANWLVVWHQDTALPLRERKEAPGWGPWSVKGGVIYAHAPASALYKVLALRRVHLDDSTAQNGPLRVLPGTHTLGVLEDEAIQQLVAQISPIECEVPRSGVLAMRPLLIHSSSKSQSEAPRRVLHFEYAASPCVAEGFDLRVA